MRKALLILEAAALILCSCSKSFSPSISITPSLSNVPCTGGSVDIRVMTDLPWKAVLAEDDVTTTLSKSTGIGDDVVTVTVAETDRLTTGCVTVKFYASSNSANVYKTAYITQEFKPLIIAEGSVPTLPREGGLVTVTVTSNSPWQASCDTPGVEFSPESETVGNFTVTVRVPANTTGSARRITLNFKIDGGSDHFYLSQY